MFNGKETEKKVLLVSDAPYPEILLGRDFCEYNEVFAYDAEDQIKEAVNGQSPDLIFIDYMTPDISFLSIITFLRNHFNTKTTPIYILDTQGEILNRTFCKEILGADGYISGSMPLISNKQYKNSENIYELDW